MVKEIVEQALIEAKAIVEKIESLGVEIEAEKQASYDEGFKAGLASNGIDKLYSQAELDAKIQDAVLPLNEQVKVLAESVESLKLEVESGKVEAVASFKAELAAKYNDLQVAETVAETGFGELLK